MKYQKKHIVSVLRVFIFIFFKKTKSYLSLTGENVTSVMVSPPYSHLEILASIVKGGELIKIHKLKRSLKFKSGAKQLSLPQVLYFIIFKCFCLASNIKIQRFLLYLFSKILHPNRFKLKKPLALSSSAPLLSHCSLP